MMQTDHELAKNQNFEKAILYTIEDDELTFNVVYYGKLNKAIVTDESGNGIDSVSALEALLGDADAPEKRLSADLGTRAIGKAVLADLTLDSDGNISSVNIKSVTERAVIGISWKKDSVAGDYQRFAEAFERNGAIAVYLPLPC